MPESSGRKVKPAKVRKPRAVADKQQSREDLPNPVWFKPIMFGFMLLGLIWIITFYVSQAVLPIQALGNWNILIGFGIAMVGFVMSTRWK